MRVDSEALIAEYIGETTEEEKSYFMRVMALDLAGDISYDWDRYWNKYRMDLESCKDRNLVKQILLSSRRGDN